MIREIEGGAHCVASNIDWAKVGKTYSRTTLSVEILPLKDQGFGRTVSGGFLRHPHSRVGE